MRHTPKALYFYGATKNSLHKLMAIFENMFFRINDRFNYHLQLLCLKFLSKTHLNFKKLAFGINIVLYLKSSL
jgi:hypothetical protein